MNFPKRLELLLRNVFAFPNASSNGFAAQFHTSHITTTKLFKCKLVIQKCAEAW